MAIAGGSAIGELGPVLSYVPVAVAGAPAVEICVDPAAGDPVAAWLLDHDWIDEPVQRVFLDLVRASGPGAKVLDLGCHLGMFSLAASALGAAVLAVDANPEHVRLLRLAAARNGFGTVEVVNVAVADRGIAAGASTGADPDAAVTFVPRSIHGFVPQPGEVVEGAISVPAASVDRLLAGSGWAHLDVVKMDIEGCEPAALRGMQALFASGCRPAMVLECNGPMLALQGSSVLALRQMLADLGYDLLLIDHLRPGVLVRTTVDAVQTEAASDLVAVAPGGAAAFGQGWRVDPPFTVGRIVARLLDSAASPAAGYRRYAAGLLRDGPAWLRDHPAVGPAVEALDHDVESEVRRRDAGSAGHDHADAAAPLGPPGHPVTIWAEEAALRLPATDLERPPGLERSDREVVLRQLSFHVNGGEIVAVLVDTPGGADALLRAVEGQQVVVRGTFDVRCHVVSLRAAGLGLEPKLSIRDNAILFGAFLGSHVSMVESRLDQVLAGARLDGEGATLLERRGSEAATRLLLAVALVCTQPEILLVGDLPLVGDGPFREWVAERSTQLARDGTSVLQVASEPGSVLVEPGRVLEMAGGRLRAAGHAGSVREEANLRRLGFRSGAGGWQPASGA